MANGSIMCCRCKTDKVITEFNPSKLRKKHYMCRSCECADRAKRTQNNYERLKSYWRLKIQQYRSKNPERYRAYMRKYRKTEKHRSWQTEYAKGKKPFARIKCRYGISYDDYCALLKKQNSVCAICKKQETSLANGPNQSKKPRRLSVDHNHLTGKVRGLLCQSCNAAVSKYGDTPKHFFSVIDYLDEAGEFSYA